MNSYKNIKKFLEIFCSENLKHKDDIVGEQVSINENKIINKIIVSLDCSKEVIEKAIKKNFKLIIVHHPFLYPDFQIALESESKKEKYNLLKKNNIAVFSLHTNYDEKYLKYLLLDKFKITKKEDLEFLIIKGTLEKQKSLLEFIKEVKNIFKIKTCDWFGNLNSIIKTISICPGSGGFALKTSHQKNIDVLITGELKWNYWLKAKELNQNVIVVGHQMEEEFTNHMTEKIEEYFKLNKLKIKIIKIFYNSIKTTS